MPQTIGILFAAGIIATALPACRPQARPIPAPPVGVVTAPENLTRSVSIDGDSAGPVRLGMPADEVRRLPDMQVSLLERRLEGIAAPTLRVSRFGIPQVLAELDGDKVWRIRVLSEHFRTRDGAHVGMSARELQKLYGPGKLVSGEAKLCALFDKAPGISFCFRGAPKTRGLTWPQVAAKNLRVGAILVTGS